MGVSLLAGQRVATSVAAGTTLYTAIGMTAAGMATLHTTEVNIQVPYFNPTTLSKLYTRVITNDRGTSTYRLRKNGSNGNQSVSITASTTGEFSDAVNTDSIASGDLVNGQLITGAGGTTFTATTVNALYTPNINSQTITKFINNNRNEVATITAASTTYYHPVSGFMSLTSTTEANLGCKLATIKGTLSNMSLYVISNTFASAAFTCISRKNGSNGNMSVSVGTLTTGLFQDNVNSDTVVTGDLLNYASTTGVGAGSATYGFLSNALKCVDGRFQMAAISSDTFNANVTSYYALVDLNKDNTEANNSMTAIRPFFVTNLAINISINNVTAASTLRFRKNSANSALSTSITASTTGFFTDNANLEKVVATDEMDYQIVSGATGTNMTIRQISTVFNNVPGGLTTYGVGI